MIRQTIVGAMWFATMSAAACFGANAQTSTPLMAGGAIQTNGWNVAISSCTYTPLGGSQTSCAPGSQSNLPSGDALQIVTSSHGADFQIINTLGGAVLSVVSTSTAFQADINYTVLITQVTPSSATLDSISAAVSGTTSSNNQYLSDISVGLGVTTGSGTQTFNSYANGTTTGPVTFTPTTLVSLSYDLKLNAGSTPGITLTVNNQTTNAPEPATLAILGSAVLGLARLRRSKAPKQSEQPVTI